MDPSLYSAAMEGKVRIPATTTTQPLDEKLALNGNTVIHVAAQYGNNKWIDELLGRVGSSLACKLLRAVNSKDETALHVAAREGYPLVIGVLVQHAKALEDAASADNSSNLVRDILTCTNKDDDTALHLALRSSIANHLQDVDRDKSALQKETSSALTRTISTMGKKIMTREGSMTTNTPSSEGTDKGSYLATVKRLVFPSFGYLANKAGETPLYLAAECECFELVKKIAESAVTSPEEPDVDNYSGPGGRTALHAAVTSNHQENTEYLWNWKTDLAKKPDVRGWTPLHCAAEFGREERVKQLLELGGKSLAYQITTKDEDTALHIAARKGRVSVINQLVSECPGCWEMVNAKDQNVLHVAIENGQQEVIRVFEQDPPSLGSLVNQKDINGDTPIHIAAMYCRNLDLSKLNHARLQRISFNKANQTPLDLLESSDRGSSAQKKTIKEQFIKAGLSKVSRNGISSMSAEQEKARIGEKTTEEALANDEKQTDDGTVSVQKEVVVEGKPGDDDDQVIQHAITSSFSSSVVAALVSTVTFTAGITVPGGYNSTQGPDQGSALLLKHAAFQVFVVADTAAFLLSTLSLLLYALPLPFFKVIDHVASETTYFSVIAMVLAFTAGTYSVLSQLPALAVPLCVVTSIYSVFLVFLFLCMFPGRK